MTLTPNLQSKLSMPICMPDDPSRGVPSVIATPHTQQTIEQPREYATRSYRPLLDSGLREFAIDLSFY